MRGAPKKPLSTEPPAKSSVGLGFRPEQLVFCGSSLSGRISCRAPYAHVTTAVIIFQVAIDPLGGAAFGRIMDRIRDHKRQGQGFPVRVLRTRPGMTLE
jgi:hypothetical protein